MYPCPMPGSCTSAHRWPGTPRPATGPATPVSPGPRRRYGNGRPAVGAVFGGSRPELNQEGTHL